MKRLLKKNQPKTQTSVGTQIIEGLTELAEALEKRQPLAQQFRSRRVVVGLKPRSYDPDRVKSLRGGLGASQALFALFLGVSVKTVQSWEQGYLSPNKMACRFMDAIQADLDVFRERLREMAASSS